LEQWPNMMEDSRSLRRDAIQLAQLVDFASRQADDNVAAQLWSDTNEGIKQVRKQYDGIFGNKAYVTLLQTDPIFDPIKDDATEMWNNIDKFLARENKTPAERKATLQEINGQTKTLIKAAFVTEYWATDVARNLVAQYKTVTATAQSKVGNGTTAPSGASHSGASPSAASLEFEHEPSLELAAWHGDYKPIDVAQTATTPNPPSPQGESGDKRLDEEANSYKRAPDWMTTTLSQTRSEYKTSWRDTLFAGLVGAGLGFIGLMLLTALLRTYTSPRGQEQLGLLTRSLSFRADVADQFAREMGALHLDVLSYLLGDSKAHEAKTEPRQIEDHVYTRIKQLRGKLRERTV
jgi:hypothetical protein